MKDRFSPKARVFWDKIPSDIQERLLRNVWCTQCSCMTMITDVVGKVDHGDLVLEGFCNFCKHPVARLVEGE